MAGAGAVRAGRAFIEFFADDSKLNKSLNQIKKRLQGWGSDVSAIGKGVAAAGAAVLTPLLAASKLFDSMGSQLLDMSARTGASVESLSSLGFAASQSSASLEDVEIGLKKMSKFAFAAATGSQEAETALRRLGLSIDDISKLAPDRMFRLIASRIAAIQNPAAKAAMALMVFGKTGTILLPMINELGALEKRAQELGIVMSKEDAQAADRLGDSWHELLSVGKAIVFQVGAALAPVLTNLATKAAETASAFIFWVRENRELIITVAKISGIVIAAGAAIFLLGGALTILGMIFGAIATAAAAFASVLAFIGGALVFIISPIGLVLIGLAALTVAFFTLTDMGQQALQFLGEMFVNFSNEAVKAWQGVRDAIGSGDIGQAMVVVGSFLSLQWAKVIAFLSEKWAEFLNFIMPTAIDIAKRVANVFIDMSVSIAKTFIDMMQVLGKALGKDIIPPGVAEALKRGLPLLGIGAKRGVAANLDKLGGNITSGADADAKAALDNADKARTAFDDAVAAAARGGRKFNPKTRFGEVGDLTAGLEQSKAAVSGTFSASAAAGFGGSSQLGQVVDNTADMKKSLKAIAAKQPGIGVM